MQINHFIFDKFIKGGCSIKLQLNWDSFFLSRLVTEHIDSDQKYELGSRLIILLTWITLFPKFQMQKQLQ